MIFTKGILVNATCPVFRNESPETCAQLIYICEYVEQFVGVFQSGYLIVHVFAIRYEYGVIGVRNLCPISVNFLHVRLSLC